MSQITLRGLDPKIEDKLRRIAKKIQGNPSIALFWT